MFWHVLRDGNGVGVNLACGNESCASFQAAIGIEQVLMKPTFLLASWRQVIIVLLVVTRSTIHAGMVAGR